MPDIGVNALQNPDWSDGTENWLTCRTFDPLLCWGTQGWLAAHALDTTAGMDVLGVNSLRVDWGYSTQLDPVYGYPGMIYAGEGFDAVPGDTWRVAFDATRGSFTSNFAGILGSSFGPGSDVFVRFGITVKVGGSWFAYYMNLPSASVSGGGSLSYDETFEIPSDWPEGQYHFAVCHTGTPTLPVNTSPSGSTTYTWGFRLTFSNFWLSFEGSGGGSPGAAGVLNPYVNWPVPRFVPGFPTPCPECCIQLEWDQFESRDPLTDDAATSGILPNVPVGGPLTIGRYQTYVWEATFPGEDWVSGLAGSNDSLCPPLEGTPSGVGTTIGIKSCGNFCSFLSYDYVAVPIREYVKWLLGTPTWIQTPAFVPHIAPPSSYGGFNGDAQPGFPEVVPVPLDNDLVFCWGDPCDTPPEPPGLPAQPVYLTHEVGPGDLNIPAGGSGGLQLRGARVSPGDGGSAGSGSPGIHLGGIKGQP